MDRGCGGRWRLDGVFVDEWVTSAILGVVGSGAGFLRKRLRACEEGNA